MNETRVLEFKQEISQSFLKTVSAFANFGDGKVRFGVSDDGKVIHKSIRQLPSDAY